MLESSDGDDATPHESPCGEIQREANSPASFGELLAVDPSLAKEIARDAYEDAWKKSRGCEEFSAVSNRVIQSRFESFWERKQRNLVGDDTSCDADSMEADAE